MRGMLRATVTAQEPAAVTRRGRMWATVHNRRIENRAALVRRVKVRNPQPSRSQGCPQTCVGGQSVNPACGPHPREVFGGDFWTQAPYTVGSGLNPLNVQPILVAATVHLDDLTVAIRPRNTASTFATAGGWGAH